MDKLIVTPFKDGLIWELVEPFMFMGIEVPAGFHTDFASSPRISWTVIPPIGRYCEAAVGHDYCYYKRLFTRKKCDDLFLEKMKQSNVEEWKRKVMYRYVRMLGWIPWNNYKKRNLMLKR